MLSQHSRAQLYNKLFIRRKEAMELSRRIREELRNINFAESEFEEKAQLENVYQDLNRQENEAHKEIRLIDHALEKMRGGDYGQCDSCGRQISEKRLHALPWTTLCRKCVDRVEREKIPEEEFQGSDQPMYTSFEPLTRHDILKLSDDELVELINESINSDPDIETDDLVVSCTDGVIYLDGSLPNELQYNLLIGILQDIISLRKVEDNLNIDTLAGLDRELDRIDFDKYEAIDEDLLWRDDEEK